MKHIEAVMICDGPSDAALEHPIRWLIGKAGFRGTLSIQIPDFRVLRVNTLRLRERVEAVCTHYKPDILFIHRDAERESWEDRLREINQAAGNINQSNNPWIPVIPVRMLESWLLFDQAAIRRASGNPNGVARLDLPKLKLIESEPDPKRILTELLTIASELSGRKLRKFKPLSKRHLVAEEISDFSPLLDIAAFKSLSMAIENFVQRFPVDQDDDSSISQFPIKN